MNLISIVVPVYNESEVIGTFYDRATEAFARLEGLDYELVFVDDGSRDDSYQKLSMFAATDPHVCVLKFSRNFGHQIAITAGIDYARGDCVAVIDADLQDPPEVVSAMIDKWRQGFDVVYGVRAEREGEGAREYINVLRLLEDHSVAAVTEAAEKGLRVGAHKRDAIAQFLIPPPCCPFRLSAP